MYDDLSGLSSKALRDAEVTALYERRPYLEAYAAHTARRIGTDGPMRAVGADPATWDAVGREQLQALRDAGLQPSHSLLEIGCGTGRLARHAALYLDVAGYFGVDICETALTEARKLAAREGWADRWPRFGRRLDPHLEGSFDFAFAFSVAVHLPRELWVVAVEAVARALKPKGAFLFSVVESARDERTGLKKFHHSLDTYASVLRLAGFTPALLSPRPLYNQRLLLTEKL